MNDVEFIKKVNAKAKEAQIKLCRKIDIFEYSYIWDKIKNEELQEKINDQPRTTSHS